MIGGLRFLGLLVPWTLGLVTFLAAPVMLSGAGWSAFGSSLGSWGPLAVTLAAYPAGLAAAGSIWVTGQEIRRGTGFVVAALLTCALLFLVVNVVLPPDGLGLADLRGQLRDALAGARSGAATVETWLPFNDLAFQYTRRVDLTILPLLFGGVGVLTGYWTAGHSHPAVARAAQWALGAFLLVTTYFAGENGWELIVLRAAGPVPFVGDLALIVPGALLMGLGTAVVLDLGADPPPEA